MCMFESECDRCSRGVLTPDLAFGHVPETVGGVGAFCIALGTV
jgi:hypothetical protein